jgi:hypothetical protein
MLIAGGHLEHYPLVLIAGLVHCEITTVSGTAALTAEEDLNSIPGATTEGAFTVYLPSPEPLESEVAAAAAGHARLSAAMPVPESTTASRSEPLVDLDALRKVITER